jgi:beta-fructofuranosidase
MTLRLPDHWVWDAWFAVDGDTVHAFFLHAPRSLGNPDLRHGHARVGHAVSRDLRSWEYLGLALPEPRPGDIDERSTWTGSVIRDRGQWLMGFTGISLDPADNGRWVQRISLATSPDLHAWTRTDVVVRADPRWYETVSGEGREEHWRDPWLFVDDDDVLHMLVTAKARRGRLDHRGVIGHAWSHDRRTFEVGPPLSAPGEVRQLEVPQLVRLGEGRWNVLASLRSTDHADHRRARPGFVPETGTLALEGTSALGPFTVTPGPCLLGDPADRWYAARLVEFRGQRWLLAWLDQDADGRFVGELGDPIPVEQGPDGRLRVGATQEVPS